MSNVFAEGRVYWRTIRVLFAHFRVNHQLNHGFSVVYEARDGVMLVYHRT